MKTFNTFIQYLRTLFSIKSHSEKSSKKYNLSYFSLTSHFKAASSKVGKLCFQPSTLIKVFATSVIMIFSSPSYSKDYCAAIRGNGELMPAHWGALSKIVEQNGLPSAMAGGSSASITLFLVESLAMNPQLDTPEKQALAIKSFQGYFEALTQTTEGKAVSAILADKEFISEVLTALKNLDNLKTLHGEDLETFLPLLQKNISELQSIMKSPLFGDLLNPELINYLKETYTLSQQTDALVKSQLVEPQRPLSIGELNLLSQLDFRLNQIKIAVENFGSFNPFSDDTLFFRPGLINFKHMAKVFGQMADFYAGVKLRNTKIQAQVDFEMRNFLESCGSTSQGLTWTELNNKNPKCRPQLIKAILTYRHGQILDGDVSKRVEEPVGKYISTFPTTSILRGDSATQYRKLKVDYLTATTPDFGSQFVVNYSDLRFGYWGAERSLRKIESELKRNPKTYDDEKSSKFLSLGETPWLTVLSTSPAEPGLANIQELDSKQLSAGGWSDLHPTLVLSAHGCEKIIYVTRQGGDSIFGQGVAKKLVDMDGFDPSEWKDLTKPQKFEKNLKGNPRDYGRSASTWSRLYNMANPYSSIRLSLRTADEIACSNWDQFDVKKDMNELIQDSYESYNPGQRTLCEVD